MLSLTINNFIMYKCAVKVDSPSLKHYESLGRTVLERTGELVSKPTKLESVDSYSNKDS